MNIPDKVTPANLTSRTNTLHALLTGLKINDTVTITVDFIERTEARVSIQSSYSYTTYMQAVLKMSTTDIHIRDGRTSEGTWLDAMEALNVMHMFIQEVSS